MLIDAKAPSVCVMSCSGCKFWQKEPESKDEGYCHRYAPKPAEKGAPTRWQLTMAADWCGDFQGVME